MVRTRSTKWDPEGFTASPKRMPGAASVPKIQEQIVDKVVDVPVTMLHKFQQPVPQIQFVCATETSTHSAKLCRKREILQRSSWVRL